MNISYSLFEAALAIAKASAPGGSVDAEKASKCVAHFDRALAAMRLSCKPSKTVLRTQDGEFVEASGFPYFEALAMEGLGSHGKTDLQKRTARERAVQLWNGMGCAAKAQRLQKK
jgi:hypothetical protein